MTAPADKTEPKTLLAKAMGELEQLAQKLRHLVSSQPPQDLLAYLYGTLVLGARKDKTTEQSISGVAVPGANLEAAQFLLEYVHAVLASTPVPHNAKLDEQVCREILQLSEMLRSKTLIVAMMVAHESSDAQFGPYTQTLLFHALSSWILLRGQRYQALEQEFFSFSLAAHDNALRRVYGVGAKEIAEGIQAISDSIRLGHGKAMRTIMESMEDARRFAVSKGQSTKEAMAQWMDERGDSAQAVSTAFFDLFKGGVCNVSRQTQLPSLLLDDLSFAPAEETEFFAPGLYCGTPFRTLPARKKPLVKLAGEHYLTDPCFARDAAYRAVLHNLLTRDAAYAEEFKENQKRWSEAAFESVFHHQLAGATVFQEVYYRRDGNWFENDTLILLDGVMILVEAKSGGAATIASPAANFDRHARAVRDLIIKAYEQCRRFIEYLASADEVPLYARKDGRYEEVARIRLRDYWLVLPFGLTVESYSPFSTASKQLPGIDPIAGKHAFISVAIDEILVLARLLPTTGELLHYLRIRQEAAGFKQLFLFDEFDHLGAYITRNRFCDQWRSEEGQGKDLIMFDGMSAVVDDYFGQQDWPTRPPPVQEMPEELGALLGALGRSSAPGWIQADSYLRDFGFEGRKDVAQGLAPLRESLRRFPRRYFALRMDSTGLLFWLYRDGDDPGNTDAQSKAQAVAETFGVDSVLLMTSGVDARDGTHESRLIGYNGRPSRPKPSGTTPRHSVLGRLIQVQCRSEPHAICASSAETTRAGAPAGRSLRSATVDEARGGPFHSGAPRPSFLARGRLAVEAVINSI